eukprot:gene21224-28137_t
MREALQLEAKASEESRRKLMMQHERQLSEMSMMTSAQAELSKDMASAHSKAGSAEGEMAGLQLRVQEMEQREVEWQSAYDGEKEMEGREQEW